MQMEFIFQPLCRCHTNIGYAGKEKDLTLSDGCYSKGRVMHELLHTLGFWHEQSRYDRDNYVRIHMDNVQSGQTLHTISPE